MDQHAIVAWMPITDAQEGARHETRSDARVAGIPGTGGRLHVESATRFTRNERPVSDDE